jgi:hypothetical protein
LAPTLYLSPLNGYPNNAPHLDLEYLAELVADIVYKKVQAHLGQSYVQHVITDDVRRI